MQKRRAYMRKFDYSFYGDNRTWTYFLQQLHRSTHLKHLSMRFAFPMTTTFSEENAKSHTSIFNVINSDDIITDMPLSYWGFRHYENDICISINDNYSTEWQWYTSKSYVSDKNKKQKLLDSFANLAADRNKGLFRCCGAD